jgi:DNA-binding MarR family transcriptional regulator
MASDTNGSGKPFIITGADGKDLPIPAREYYFNTKDRIRRMMQNSLSSEARQVYACLELATMGFQQELAVVMERGQRRPVSPDDISVQTALSRQHVRRALAELEDEGLAERRADDDGGLRKGHVEIYSWAVPRERKCKLDCSHRAATIPDWFPESWAPLQAFIKRHKLTVVIDQTTAEELLEEGVVAARGYKDAEIVVSRFLERVCAPRDLYKEERTERTIERTEERGGVKATSSIEESEQPHSLPHTPSGDSHEIQLASRLGGSPQSPSDHAGLLRSPRHAVARSPDRGFRPGDRSIPEAPGDQGHRSHSESGAIAVSRPGSPEVVVGNPKSTDAFEVFCFVMHGCGRPVAVKCVRECRAEFFKYPPTTQQRIIEDANLRFKGDNPRFITAPLKYLCSEIWDTEPITQPLFSPPASTAQQQRDDALRRLMDRARARDQEFGDLR